MARILLNVLILFKIAYIDFLLQSFVCRYNNNLRDAKKMGIKKGVISGGYNGLFYLVFFSIYALAFWYGANLVREEPSNYTVGSMLVVSYQS